MLKTAKNLALLFCGSSRKCIKIASITDKSIKSNLAIRAIQKALVTQPLVNKLILHSDQGSKFKSTEFTLLVLKLDGI